MAVGKPSGAPSISRSGRDLTITSKVASGGPDAYIYDYRSRKPGTAWGDWYYKYWYLGAMDASRKALINGTPGYEYQFRTKGAIKETVGYAEEGPWSDVLSFTMPSYAQAVASVSLEMLSATSLKASWPATTDNGGSAVTGYKVKLYRSSTAIETITVSGSVRTKTWTGLESGKQYRVAVSVLTDVGSSSSTASSFLGLGSVPAAPAVVLNKNGTVTWNEPNNGGLPITGYEFQSFNGYVWSTVTVLGAATRSRTIAGRVPGIGYKARVKAVNSVGKSGFGTSAAVTSNQCSCT